MGPKGAEGLALSFPKGGKASPQDLLSLGGTGCALPSSPVPRLSVHQEFQSFLFGHTPLTTPTPPI